MSEIGSCQPFHTAMQKGDYGTTLRDIAVWFEDGFIDANDLSNYLARTAAWIGAVPHHTAERNRAMGPHRKPLARLVQQVAAAFESGLFSEDDLVGVIFVITRSWP